MGMDRNAERRPEEFDARRDSLGFGAHMVRRMVFLCHGVLILFILMAVAQGMDEEGSQWSRGEKFTLRLSLFALFVGVGVALEWLSYRRTWPRGARLALIGLGATPVVAVVVWYRFLL